jgi:hypothetical protein
METIKHYGGINMKHITIENAYKKGGNNLKRFTEAAEYITEHYVGETPGHPLTTEDRNVIMECMAVDFATGAELIKGKYLLIGLLTGVIGTVIVVGVKNRIKKKS